MNATPKDDPTAHGTPGAAVNTANTDTATATANGSLDTCTILGDRSRGDGCPGAIRMHKASDGYIGRVRFPGGFLTASDWEKLAATAATFGDGDIHMTTRGNVQIRGVRDQEGLSAHLAGLGWIPSPDHDKMRNIITEPLDPAWAPWARRLDEKLRAQPAVAPLSGRTLFGLDGGFGQVTRFAPDFGLQRAADSTGANSSAPTGEHAVHLVLAGTVYQPTVTLDEALDSIVAMATLWAEIRGPHWRVKEHPDAHPELLAAAGLKHATPLNPTAPGHNRRPVGWFSAHTTEQNSQEDTPQEDTPTVSLGIGVPFGRISNEQAQLLAAIGHDTTVSPWPTITIHALTEGEAEAIVKVMAPRGFVFHDDSPQLRITACTGQPGCDKSATDVRADAHHLMNHPHLITAHAADAYGDSQLPQPEDNNLLIHFSGCQRRCGHPGATHLDYTATADGEYTTTVR
ncbi:precorrin-3B synthase [Corynebacterium aquilae]|uniref:precorrin-3B synthase n=1 Tax=Corynebacterium aquilae TaxID=203263 RepID=UPI0012ED6E0C|nr:precorrin-3B synthase [Corynebacterium aquilae]